MFHTNNICNTTFDNIQLETKQKMNDAKNVLISQCDSSKTGMTISLLGDQPFTLKKMCQKDRAYLLLLS